MRDTSVWDDPEKLAFMLDVYQRLTTSMQGLMQLIKDLPEAERDPLIALLQADKPVSPRALNAYLKIESIYREIKATGKYKALEDIVYERFIRPKRLILLARQKILVRLRQALDEMPVEPRLRDEWLRGHTPFLDLDLGLPPEDEEPPAPPAEGPR
jgi:hypothetical protein